MAVITMRMVQEWGVVTPDDNDVVEFGPDRAEAEETLRDYHEEGQDTAKLVYRWVSDWIDAPASPGLATYCCAERLGHDGPCTPPLG